MAGFSAFAGRRGTARLQWPYRASHSAFLGGPPVRILGSARARAAVLLAVAAGTLTATPAYAGTATFSGTITSATTGEPLGGACVLLFKEEGDTAYEQYPESCTESDGAWSKTDLEPGTYFVQATGYGYVTQYAYGHDGIWDSERFTVADGDAVTVDLAMEQAGEVVGTVTDDATGEPIPDTCVSVNSADGYGHGCTGEDGTYSVFVRPGSDYRVDFQNWSGGYLSEYAYDTTDWEAAELFTVVAGETITVDAGLARGSSISGAVTDAATGAPLPNVCVIAATEVESVDATGGYTCTDDEGGYRMPNVTPGTYHVAVEDESGAHVRTYHPASIDPAGSVPVTVGAAEDVTGVDIAVSPAAYVSGVVTSAATGQPITDVCVSATRPDGSWLRNAGPASCADAEGRYTLGGLPAGEVKVLFNPIGGSDLLQQWAYGQPTAATASLIPVVTGETTTGVDAAMQEGGRISGRVVNAKTKQPIEGVCATVGVFSHRSGENGTQWPPSCTGADGRYEMRGLPTGSYTVEFYDPDGAWAWQFFPNKADRVQAAKLAVTAGQERSGVNAKLVPGGVVEGVVIDEATGEPADGVCLDPFTARAHDPFGTGWCTGPDGRYTMRGFPTTKVKISVIEGGPYAPEWAFDRPTFETATPIATAAGGTTTANLVVSPS